MMDKSLGKRIRALRELRKLSQEKVAEKCGVETSSVSRWETGGLSPNSKHLTQLAKALEVNKSDFFIAPESPVPENVLLAEILKVAHDLSPQEQSLLLDIAYGLRNLIFPSRLYHIFSFFKEFCLNSRNLCIKL